MGKKSTIKQTIHEFSIDKDGDYIDVKVHLEGYLTMRIETTDFFTIETEAEIDFIANKLKEALKNIPK